MTYAEADRASKKNKEFIKGLFPEGAIYATLLPQNAQDVIGKVGVQTKGVEKMLRRIGFSYAYRVDPFDGGPHFVAPTDDVLLVQRTHQASVTKLLAPSEYPKTRALVAVWSRRRRCGTYDACTWRGGRAARRGRRSRRPRRSIWGSGRGRRCGCCRWTESTRPRP